MGLPSFVLIVFLVIKGISVLIHSTGIMMDGKSKVYTRIENVRSETHTG